MADKSLIEWTDATWNPITGCTLVDEGCRHCYAAHLITSWPAIGNHPSRKDLARKNAAGESKFTGEVRFNEGWLDQPLRWKKPRRIFVCAHGDLFHESVPDDWIAQVFAIMALCPQHTFQVLTKRPDRAEELIKAVRRPGLPEKVMGALSRMKLAGKITQAQDNRAVCRPITCLPNLWLGTSISDQASADLRIPQLLATPAAVRFVSAEPLLGQVDLTLDSLVCGPCPYCADGSPDPETGLVDCPRCDGTGKGDAWALDWVIVGGESGPHARPMHPDWARSLRDQCQAAGVPFLFKQWGEWLPYSQFAGDGDSLYHSLANPESEASRRCKYENCTLTSEGQRHSTGKANDFHRMEDGAFSGPSPMSLFRVGKRAAGRHLDGREWNEFPGVPHA